MLWISFYLKIVTTTPTEYVTGGKAHPKTSFLYITRFFLMIYMSHSPLMNLLWESFGSLTWRRPSCIPTCRRPFKRFRLCDIFKLLPTPQSFLFYYNSRLSTLVSWLSLTSRLGSIRFAAFTSSYKNFKEKYFKILWSRTTNPFIYDAEGRTTGPKIQQELSPGRGLR